MSEYRVGLAVINTGVSPLRRAYRKTAATVRPLPTPVWSELISAEPRSMFRIANPAASIWAADMTLNSWSLVICSRLAT